MNKKAMSKVLLISIIIVILIVGIAIYFILNKSENSVNNSITGTKSVDDCNKMKQVYNKSICYHEVAVYKKDFSICGMIPSAMQSSRNICYEDVAKLRKNAAECEAIPQNFQDDCYFGVADGKSDYRICDNILYSVYKWQCYEVVAVNLKDKTICDKIERSDIKDDCYFQFS
jgi:uncharacterized protein YxeA